MAVGGQVPLHNLTWQHPSVIPALDLEDRRSEIQDLSWQLSSDFERSQTTLTRMLIVGVAEGVWLGGR